MNTGNDNLSIRPIVEKRPALSLTVLVKLLRFMLLLLLFVIHERCLDLTITHQLIMIRELRSAVLALSRQIGLNKITIVADSSAVDDGVHLLLTRGLLAVVAGE